MAVSVDFLLTVQERDIAEARAAWVAAGERGAPVARVEELLDDYARLVRAHDAQLAERRQAERRGANRHWWPTGTDRAGAPGSRR